MGAPEEADVGGTVGFSERETVGTRLGADVGEALGLSVGTCVGEFDGAVVDRKFCLNLRRIMTLSMIIL